MNKFSYFSNGVTNTIPNDSIDILKFVELIKIKSSAVDKVRLCKDKAEKDKLKRKLDYVTFGGTFTNRSMKGLIESSGYACLDFDDIENLEEAKEKLKQDEYTFCLFISPSGNGLKLIVKIPQVKDNEEYKEYWNSISEHFNLLETDEASKDISRACFMSYDENPYLNLDSKIYTAKKEKAIIQEQGEQGFEKRKINYNNKIISNNLLEEIKSRVSMVDILSHFGVDTSRNPTYCPFHSCSQRCFSFNNEVCNCFDTDCNSGYNIFSFVKKIKNFSSSETIKWLSDFAGLNKEYEESKREFILKDKQPKGWALSINIKKMAERKGWLNCPSCNAPFIFNEQLGNFKCSKCGNSGSLTYFVKLMRGIEL